MNTLLVLSQFIIFYSDISDSMNIFQTIKKIFLVKQALAPNKRDINGFIVPKLIFINIEAILIYIGLYYYYNI